MVRMNTPHLYGELELFTQMVMTDQNIKRFVHAYGTETPIIDPDGKPAHSLSFDDYYDNEIVTD